MRLLAAALQVVGLAAVVVGVALVSAVAGLIVGGLALVAVGVAVERGA